MSGELMVEGLRASYGAARIIDGLSLQVHAGEAVGVVGRNGMGKTTLVRALMGLDPPVCTAGEITWDGAAIRRAPSYARSRRGMGYVPQGRHVFGSLTVEQNLTTTARPARSGNRGALVRGDGWTLDRVYDLFPRLRERRRNQARNLSGGEQQMVAIGRALMTNPKLLIMDEPSEGLAPTVIEMLIETFRKLEQEGLRILLIEQNLGVATAIAERQLVMVGGEIAAETTAAQLSQDPDLQRRYLGVEPVAR
jgi:branched-chain amino acid transport system ATP-binding protein